MNRYAQIAIGVVVGAVAIGVAVSPSGRFSIKSNSPGLVFGSGNKANPLNVRTTVDGITITGTGSSGSPFSSQTIANVNFGLFGDGADAAASPCGTISANTSLTRTINCTSLTVNSGVTLTTNGWAIRVAGTLQLDGKISWSGTAASSGTGGGALTNQELRGGTAGGAGATSAGNCINGASWSGLVAPDECTTGTATGGTASAAGTSGTKCRGAGGGGGTAGGPFVSGCSGQDPSVAISGVATTGSFRAPLTSMYWICCQGKRGGSSPFGVSYAGGGGGAGGGFGAGGGAGQAGGGGGGGGNVIVVAQKILGSGSIESKGGNGGAATCSAAGCGGGGGGGGGNVTVVIGTGSFPTITTSGGTAGAGVNGGASGGVGGAGFQVTLKAGV